MKTRGKGVGLAGGPGGETGSTAPPSLGVSSQQTGGLPVYDIASPFLVGASTSTRLTPVPSRRPAPSLVGPLPKRARPQPTVEEVEEEDPLSPSDVDQLLRGPTANPRPGREATGRASGLATPRLAYMHSGAALDQAQAPPPRSPSPPLAPCRVRQRLASLDPYWRASPDRMPSPMEHEEATHDITLSDSQL
ncbi:hypothetical protein C0992_006091 [Termitomyces sp. T32_za158]|nr:hypothetical protein C0992_006091 [Termitomyces sp. T32_za158]